jgi:hypothetical protein
MLRAAGLSPSACNACVLRQLGAMNVYAYLDVVYGWCPNLNITHLDHLIDRMAGYCPLALITCIDSSRNPGELVPALETMTKAQISWQIHGLGIVVPTRSLTIVANLLLNGFDEIWLLRSNPATDSSPPMPVTSEIPLPEKKGIDGDRFHELVLWFDMNNCVLGLGDGYGLNYMTTDPHTAESIESLDH